MHIFILVLFKVVGTARSMMISERLEHASSVGKLLFENSTISTFRRDPKAYASKLEQLLQYYEGTMYKSPTGESWKGQPANGMCFSSSRIASAPAPASAPVILV